MKLLTKPEIKSKIKSQNEDLIVENVRLRNIHSNLLQKINLNKGSLDKNKELKEYELFCEEINHKKSKLLKELNQLEHEIEKKKEIIFGLIEKQDELMEREYLIKERETKLDLREGFIQNIENKIYGM